MKTLILTAIIMFGTLSLIAKEINPTVDNYAAPIPNIENETNYGPEMKVIYLSKLLDHQQKSYEERVAFLEQELQKTKNRLIEKSMDQERNEEAIKTKYSTETTFLKRELAYKTKSLLEYQRQIEKMKPSEDLKNMIKLNTELASELRRTEDQVAIMQLKAAEEMRGQNTPSRLPASIKNK